VQVFAHLWKTFSTETTNLNVMMSTLPETEPFEDIDNRVT
jgi:hypothetical protein